MSWVARALPAKRVWTQPSRISWATCSAEPVWTIAGPPTSRTFLPAARVARIASATPWRLTALGFSLETFEPMKPNRRRLARPLGRDDADARRGRRRSACPSVDVGHRHAPGRLASTGRRRSRSPSPGRRRRPSGRRGGPGSAGWSCCRSRRGRPRRCRPATTWASSGWTGEAPCSTRSPRIASSSAGRAGPDGDPGVARVDPPGADRALADLERPAHLEDAVEDLGQEQRVDDVAADLDLLDHPLVRARRGRVPPVVAVHGIGVLPVIEAPRSPLILF